MADIIKQIGSTAPAPDYADIALWNAGEGAVDPGVGFTSIGLCYGDIGTSDTINGAFIRGYSLEGQVTYDGTNESSLAMIDRLTVSTTGNISDIKITSTNAFITAMSVSVDGCDINRCRVSHPTASGVPALSITSAIPATTFYQCVITGGNDSVRAGFAQGAAFNKCVVLDSTDKGFEGSGGAGVLTATDVYTGNSAGNDYDTGQLTLSFAASSDATGSAGLQNITVASALVNVGIDDYRTKLGGPLDGTGSVDFIGAFLESSSGITVTADSQPYNVTFYDATIDLAGEIAVTGGAQPHNVTFYDATIDLTGEVLVNAEFQDYQVQFFDAQVSLVSGIEIQAQSQNYNVAFFNASVQLSGDIDISAESQSYSVTFYDATVSITELWTDKPKAVTNWVDKAQAVTIWTDK